MMHIIAGIIIIFGISVADLRMARVQEHTGKRFMLINMTRVRGLIPYGFMFIWLLQSMASLISTTVFNSPGWSAAA